MSEARDTAPVDLLDGTRTILRALQGRMARDLAAGKSVGKADQRQLVELTERVERLVERREAVGVGAKAEGPQAGGPAPVAAMTDPAHESGLDRFCGAETRRSKKPCGRPAGWGTEHPGVGRCKLHGGSTPSHQLAARQALAEREIRAHLGVPLDTDPATAILEALREAAGNVEYLRRRVQEPGSTEALIDYQGKPHTNPVLAFYNEERDRLARYAKLAADMRIDEVRVRLATSQGQALAEVVQVAVDACNPSDDERVAAIRAAGEKMRALGVGAFAAA